MSITSYIAKMLEGTEPVKAELWVPEKTDWSIEFPFNPASFSIARSVHLSAGNEVGAPWPSLYYTRGSADSLTFDALLDETEPRDLSTLVEVASRMNPLVENVPLGPSNDDSVLPDIAKFWRLTLPLKVEAGSTGGTMRPPIVVFIWEQFQFIGMVESVRADVTLFDDKGRPRRAMLNIAMKGRAMQSSTAADKFFSPAYTAKAASGFQEKSAPLLGDPRLELLKIK